MKNFLLPTGLLLLMILLTYFIPMPVDKVVFLDVGQGDSILLQHKTIQILVDGGKGTTVLPRLAEQLPWFDRRIEVLVATHPDQDHLEGLLYVLERYDVELVLIPQTYHSTDLQSEWLSRLQEALDSKEVEYRFAWQGQRIQAGNMMLNILGPFDNKVGDMKSNDASIITRIDMHGNSFLLTGDAEKRMENMLVQEYAESDILDVNIIKAGHHGSNTSTHTALLEATTPYTAIISVGDNSYGHPHPLVLDRLSNIDSWRTDEYGSVSFIYDKNRWFMQCAAKRCS